MKMNLPALATFVAATMLAAPPAASQATEGAAPSPAPSSPSKNPSSSSTSLSSDRILRATLVLDAPVESVWKLWTTEDGLKSFFAPGCRVEPRVDGVYEIYFDPSAPAGGKGAEGTRILAFEPERRLVFTWNAPPSQPAIRAQRTVVEIRLAREGEKKTRFVFTHSGWGEGPEWDATFAYFDKAWNGFVLPNLVWRVRHGPIDWKARPEVRPLVPTLKLELAEKQR